jgi:hypothetical protein
VTEAVTSYIIIINIPYIIPRPQSLVLARAIRQHKRNYTDSKSDTTRYDTHPTSNDGLSSGFTYNHTIPRPCLDITRQLQTHSFLSSRQTVLISRTLYKLYSRTTETGKSVAPSLRVILLYRLTCYSAFTHALVLLYHS